MQTGSSHSGSGEELDLSTRSDHHRGRVRKKSSAVVYSTTGKWGSPLGRDFDKRMPMKKRAPVDKFMHNGIMSQSEHDRQMLTTSSEHLRSTAASIHERRKEPADRVSRPGDDDGKLDSLLSAMNQNRPYKKKGGRTVASAPSRAGIKADDTSNVSDGMGEARITRAGRRKSHIERRPSRSSSPGVLKKKVSVVKDPKRRNSVGNPRRRTEGGGASPKKGHDTASVKKKTLESSDSDVAGSPVPVKKRSSISRGSQVKKHPPMNSPAGSTSRKRNPSPGPLKRKPSIQKRLQRNGSLSPSTASTGNEGKLGKLLTEMEQRQPKKKGERSVASAPSRRHKDKDKVEESPIPRRSRRTSNASSVVSKKKRSKSSDNEELSSFSERSGSRHRHRRSKSSEAGSVLSHSERGSTSKSNHQNDRSEVEDDTEHDWQDSRGNGVSTTQKNSGKSSQNTSTTHQGDSSSIENEATPTRRQRTQTQTPKTKRSQSAGPRAGATPRESREDRRAQMGEVKRHRSTGPTRTNMGFDDGPTNERAQSMMLHREMTRRGKSNSLADLVQYADNEIHSTSYFASNHVLVNRERMKRGLRPLTRNIAMDELARNNAKKMAETAGVIPIQATYVGNVMRGESIRAVHRSTMQQKQGRERANLLNPYFQEFGVGTAKGEDGMLYVCQLFSERLELTCADAEPTV